MRSEPLACKPDPNRLSPSRHPEGSKRIRAGDGTRTRNLLITNQLLCQLSYAGILLWHVAVAFDSRVSRPSRVALVYKSPFCPQGEFSQSFEVICQ